MSVTLDLSITYDQLAKRQFKEFGSPWYRNTIWHKVRNAYALTYNGVRIAEIYADNTLRLLIPSDTSIPIAWKTRWDMLFQNGAVTFDSKRRTSVSGLVRHEMAMLVRMSEDYKFHYHTIGTAEASQAFKVKITSSGIVFEADDSEVKTAIKDNTKHRAFAARLKRLRAIIVTQIRMGVYTEIHLRTTSHIDGYRERFGEQWMSPDATGYRLYADVMNWMDTMNPDRVTSIALMAFRRHYSNKTGLAGLEQRVANAFKYVQERYLREQCVKIEVSNNPLRPSNNDSDDQDCELLPPDGLREVSVPCEAQVC